MIKKKSKIKNCYTERNGTFINCPVLTFYFISLWLPWIGSIQVCSAGSIWFAEREGFEASRHVEIWYLTYQLPGPEEMRANWCADNTKSVVFIPYLTQAPKFNLSSDSLPFLYCPKKEKGHQERELKVLKQLAVATLIQWILIARTSVVFPLWQYCQVWANPGFRHPSASSRVASNMKKETMWFEFQSRNPIKSSP